MRGFRTLGEYHDFFAVVLSSAPDRFRDVLAYGLAADQGRRLVDAFDRLRSGFHLAQKKLKNEHVSRICQEMMEMAFAAYESGDGKTGSHVLQECRGLIWPKWALRAKYVVEAERRAFGRNIVYEKTIVSPYP